MKRQLSLVLALVMILGTFTSVFAANTVDADAAKVASEFLKKQGVLVGDTTGDLNLGKNLLRQDTVVLVSKLMGEYDKAKDFPTAEGIPTYTDVRDPFYLPLLAWAQANETFVGHTDAKFGFGENLTAQEYAKVLLVALDYTVGPNGDKDVSWADVLVKAKDLGLLADVEVENASEILRSQMAVMTFNALGTKLKGSDKTLADKLGITMPAAKELTAEVNDTVNLKEVVVELSNAKLADAEKLANKDNYRVDNIKVERVTVDGNDVILEVVKPLIKNRSYDLVVKGVDKAIDKTYSFKALDNASPKVEKVEVLGEYGIKVTVSEPVTNVKERNFLVDGKNVAMKLEPYGRVLILTPYHKTAFAANAEKLTIKELEDYAGYKSALEDFEIKVEKDTVAPKVTDVVVKGNVVEVTFDKDIYNDSVEGYINRKDEGNVSYRSGRQDIFTKQDKDGKFGEKIDTNKAKYTFEADLPRRTDVTIVGVQNHSKVEMEKTTMEAREVKDNLEPEIIDVDVKTTVEKEDGKSSAKITLEFDKNIKKDTGKFTLYTEKVLSRYEAKDYKIDSVKYDGDKRDTIVVEISGLTKNNDDKEFDYILEVRDFEDDNRNRMFRDYVEFEVVDSKTLAVDKVGIEKDTKDETVIVIDFNRPVDRVRAENPENYVFRKSEDGKAYDVADLDGEVIVERNGKTVRIELPDFKGEGYKVLEILEAVRDKDNNRLTGNRVFDLETGKAIVEDVVPDTKALNDLLADVEKLVEADYTAESWVAFEAALTEAKKALSAKTQTEIDAKLAALEKAVKGLVKLGEKEIAGNYADGLFGKYVEFNMPAGKTAIDSATLNGVALNAATFDYAVDGLKGIVNVNAKGDVIKVVIGAVEYEVKY